MSRSLALALAAGGAAALAACATPAPDPYAPLDADAHEMSPYKIHEACVKLAPGDRLDWRFESQAPVDFNIHYHDGPTVVLPVSRTASLGDAGVYVVTLAHDYCATWETGALRTAINYRIRPVRGTP
mgnify:FL=1|jgi:hypothetical protein